MAMISYKRRAELTLAIIETVIPYLDEVEDYDKLRDIIDEALEDVFEEYFWTNLGEEDDGQLSKV